MDDTTPQHDVTRLIQAASSSDHGAADQLLALVYDQLRKIAQQRMNEERRDHTLQATALVHEAYLKLVGDRDVPWRSRAHFFAAAAEAMRRILLDHAKARRRIRRGGGRNPVSLELSSVADLSDEKSETILAVDDAFRRLECEDSQAAAVVRLRFYAGLSVEDTAQALGISQRTVAREWTFARFWLVRALGELQRDIADEPPSAQGNLG